MTDNIPETPAAPRGKDPDENNQTDHTVEVGPANGATIDELDMMEARIRASLDQIEYKINGNGRIKDIEREKVRCSYLRCQARLISEWRKLVSERELAKMKERLEQIEAVQQGGDRGTITVEELFE